MKNVYSVIDRVTGIFGDPIILPAPVQGGHEQAMRWFTSAVKNIDELSKGTRCPTDYGLYFIGLFNEADGTLNGCAPVFLSNVGVAHESEFKHFHNKLEVSENE